ncbi:F0F1 ATP synthase subunit B family protein [Sphingomonas oryzagri]
MHIDWWTLALQAINVLILVWLLSRFLFRPVMDAIAARQTAANKLLADAQAAKDAAAAEAAALKAQTDSFAAEADKRRTEMQARIEVERARLLDQAKSEAAALAQQANAASAAERTRMQADLEEKAGTLAGQIAEKLLGRLPVAGTTDLLFEALLDRVRALPEDDRRKLASDAPLTVVTPGAIEEVARARYVRDLEAALPGIGIPQFAVDPPLIAGFELRGPHIQVRNSWRADLDDVLATLKEDDHARIG